MQCCGTSPSWLLVPTYSESKVANAVSRQQVSDSNPFLESSWSGQSCPIAVTYMAMVYDNSMAGS
ncbi:hypothetical protein SCLCIDRAFT_1224937 [Scleroderma citrinum Foug A]|uniref:Uncharacterized protein n=1 Tax=Scleroderma citrinum Foug A TaxID=1036808 RepID=A0A0C3D3P0_9AGAM|nr:hypothetical protein SCLCIDRAFT_1224937 [Scleroderma citrinum Foug A]